MTISTTIELFKEDMKFSAAHFTIFSKTERENLHGHNYQVYAAITAAVAAQGLSFNYQSAKKRLRELCASLDETLLLPSLSAYLTIEEKAEHYEVGFNEETLFFLKRDATLLPVANITVEALSAWLLEAFTTGPAGFNEPGILAIEIKVFSGPGQSGSSRWERKPSKQH